MPKNGLNVSLNSYDDIFSTEETRQEEQREQVQQIPIDELYPFKDHPFKVLDDEAMQRTVLKGMMHFVELYHGEFSEERLLRALRNIHPVDIYRIGQDDPAKLRGWKKYVFPIYTAYNGKCRKDALPMKF